MNVPSPGVTMTNLSPKKDSFDHFDFNQIQITPKGKLFFFLLEFQLLSLSHLFIIHV